MKSRTHLTLFVLLLLCLPSDCFGQTIHIHFGDKKTKKTSSRRAVPEPAVTATKRKEFSAEPELASPLALPAFTSPTSFTSLAPKNADVLLAMRPQRMLEYTPLHSKLSEAATIAGRAGLDAMNFNEIDLIMIASNSETISRTIQQQQRQLMEHISAALEEGSVTQESESLADHLEEGFAALIRFKTATSWDLVEPEMRSMYSNFKGEKKLMVRQWRGLELLCPEDDHVCSVIRLDERTFLFCNRNQLATQLEAPVTESVRIGNWLDQFSDPESGFQGDFFVAGRTPAGLFPTFLLPPEKGWQALAQLNEVKLAISYQDEAMLNVDLKFNESAKGSSFLRQVRESLNDMRRQMRMAASKVSESAAPKAMLEDAQFYVEMIDGVRLSRIDSTVNLAFDKPEGFDQRLKNQMDYAQNMGVNMGMGTQEFKELPETNTVKMAPVVVMVRSVEAGEKLKASDIRVENWPAQLIPEESVQKMGNALGRMTLSRLGKGMPVRDDQLK